MRLFSDFIEPIHPIPSLLSQIDQLQVLSQMRYLPCRVVLSIRHIWQMEFFVISR